MLEINIHHTRIIRVTFILLLMTIINCQSGISQRFNSLVGVKAGYNTASFSIKIALDENNYLEGTIGVLTPQPDYTFGPGIAYHRHISLNESKDFQFYYGLGAKGVIGDETAIGLGVDAGLIYIYKNISLGLDLNPTYFFNDVLEFRPLYGINLRWVND
ncbi:MAG: hypothetical protein ACJATI_003358 [Halioglobus sp.]|jgi:hypothetical protein